MSDRNYLLLCKVLHRKSKWNRTLPFAVRVFIMMILNGRGSGGAYREEMPKDTMVCWDWQHVEGSSEAAIAIAAEVARRSLPAEDLKGIEAEINALVDPEGRPSDVWQGKRKELGV